MQMMRDLLVELKEESSKLKLELAHTESVTFTSEQLMSNDVELPECLTVVLTHIISTLQLLPLRSNRHHSHTHNDKGVHHTSTTTTGPSSSRSNILKQHNRVTHSNKKQQHSNNHPRLPSVCGNISPDDSITSSHSSNENNHYHSPHQHPCTTTAADRDECYFFKEAPFIVLNAVSSACPIVYASPGFIELTGKLR